VVRNVAGRVVGEITVTVPDPSLLEEDHSYSERTGSCLS
jgi:hypothetical protein